MWFVRILFAWIFGVMLNMGVAAIWWCMVADLGCRSVLFAHRYFQGKWTEIQV